MSRQAASKSRTEKGASRGGGGAQSVLVPTVTNDIVPGRLTDGDWSRLMLDEDDTNFVGTLVEEIVDQALDGCYEKYIWDQVLPFTVHQAKDALLQIVQWHFLSHDSGEVDIANDPGWKEDSEPEAGIIDSWAQGSVPVVVRPHSSSVPSMSMISEEQPFSQGPPGHANMIADSLVSGTEPTATTLSDEHTDSTEKSGENETVTEEKNQPAVGGDSALVENGFTQEPVKVTKKKKTSYKRHTGRLLPPVVSDFENTKQNEEVSAAVDSAKQDAHLSPSQKTLLKVQAGRPPGNREVTFDERGNVVGVMKLNAQTLPTHRVRVQYSIIDPEAEANAQRLVAMRTGRIRRPNKPNSKSDDSSEIYKNFEPQKPAKPPTLPRMASAATSSFRSRNIAMSVQHLPPGTEAILRSQRSKRSVANDRRVYGARIDPLPPMLIDTIDASPGVIIREGEHVKMGPEEGYPVGVLRVLDKDLHHKDKPILRSLGNKYANSNLRPSINPRDVVQEVKCPDGQTVLAISNVLPKAGSEQTAGT